MDPTDKDRACEIAALHLRNRLGSKIDETYMYSIMDEALRSVGRDFHNGAHPVRPTPTRKRARNTLPIILSNRFSSLTEMEEEFPTLMDTIQDAAHRTGQPRAPEPQKRTGTLHADTPGTEPASDSGSPSPAGKTYILPRGTTTPPEL